MPDAVTSSLGIVAYLALFATVGIVFLLVNLLVGRLVRPQNPHPEKLELYECGEPAVGTGFVQFDLRFYVVALLFIIFDVEVAFFFPWATVFGKATQLSSLRATDQVIVQDDEGLRLTAQADALYRELGVLQGPFRATCRRVWSVASARLRRRRSEQRRSSSKVRGNWCS